MIGKDFNRQDLVPAYYRLGLWRVQYLQRKCCVCQINKATNFMPNTTASIMCQRCHDDMRWLPNQVNILLESNPRSKASSPVSTFLNQSANNQTKPDLLEPAVLHVQSAAPYLGYIRAAITSFKYAENVKALPILLHALQQLPRPKGYNSRNSLILPMPTTNQRLINRGFNPVMVLAYYLSQHWQIPVWHGVDRIDDAGSQQGLSRQQRRENIQNAFKLNGNILNKQLILFDDVVTTGTTLKSLASYLHAAMPSLKFSAYTVATANY